MCHCCSMRWNYYSISIRYFVCCGKHAYDANGRNFHISYSLTFLKVTGTCNLVLLILVSIFLGTKDKEIREKVSWRNYLKTRKLPAKTTNEKSSCREKIKLILEHPWHYIESSHSEKKKRSFFWYYLSPNRTTGTPIKIGSRLGQTNKQQSWNVRILTYPLELPWHWRR